MRIFEHPSSLEHDPRVHSPEHPDVPERIEAIVSAMDSAGWPGSERVLAPAATDDELELIHDAGHVNWIRELCASGGGQIDADTAVGEASYQAAVYAAGAACEMVRSLVSDQTRTGFCIVRPAGHHAERDRAMGFCLFNNVAIATELAIRRLGLERVFVLDWDVHHGNGAAEIFRRRDDVLFASIHQAGLFPGTGSLADAGSGAGLGYTINVPVPSRSDEEIWLSVLEHVILPAAAEFRPQLVLISAGYDAHRDDPLGDCLLERESFAQMACQVRDLAQAANAPVGAVLEGRLCAGRAWGLCAGHHRGARRSRRVGVDRA